jgi:deazaflavin-dependent oxidoreductase (nitroreductase family)
MMKFHPPNKVFSRAYRKFLYRPMGRLVLLLTTTGRKTGKLHTIGLQYELIDGKYYLGAADGTRADWYRNILKNDKVFVQAGSETFRASASVINDLGKITEFLEYRLNKRPLMIRLILRLDGSKGKIDRAALETYARKIGLVVLSPIHMSEA